MRDQNGLILRHAKGRTLGVRSTQELRGRDICSRDTFFFERDDIVRTARYAAASIAERFNDRVTLFLQFPLNVFSRRPTWGRFRPPQRLCDAVLLAQDFL